MRKRWIMCQTDTPEIRSFAEELGVSHILAALLWQRDIREVTMARRFLYPETEQEFYDPFLMQDMEKAVEHIAVAVENKQKITVYGDYDVDGITATSLIMRALHTLGLDANYYIPDRAQEGYGLNLSALKKLKSDGTELIVTVDCGIVMDEDIIENLASLPKIIVTDHHLPGEELPPVLAVVDPHREDCPYPDKNLAGVGVAFKLCQALWQKLRKEDFVRDLDIVAMGTIADIVPLVGENRKMVRLGLNELSHSKNCGVNALIEIAGLLGKQINSGQVGFGLAPRINAAGRIGNAMDGVRLLLAPTMREARPIAEVLHDANSERQAAERRIVNLAEKMLAKEDISKLHSIVLSGDDWHSGVIGIVASRLVERHYLPTIIISRQGEVSRGSCRSIKSLNIHAALEHCKEYLIGFGGHSQAAGLTIATDKIDAFRAAFDAYVAQNLSEDDYEPTLNIEFELSPAMIDAALVKELGKLEPYGMGNPKPLFGYKHLQANSVRAIGRDLQHMSIQIPGKNGPMTILAWDRSEYVDVVRNEPIDIVFVPQVDEWQGRINIECVIQDFQVSSHLFPDRPILVKIYTMLKQLAEKYGRINANPCTLTAEYCRSAGSISLYTMQCAVKIFSELGILAYADETKSTYILPPVKGKFDLNDSPLYRKNVKN